jgi:hypothetical protein
LVVDPCLNPIVHGSATNPGGKTHLTKRVPSATCVPGIALLYTGETSFIPFACSLLIMFKLLHGIEINDVEYNVSLIFSDTTVVSFMKLPSYIEDEDIISKLQAKGIKLVSPVYRRAIPGTQVADGTRFVKCVFPPGFVALRSSFSFFLPCSLLFGAPNPFLP